MLANSVNYSSLSETECLTDCCILVTVSLCVTTKQFEFITL